MRNESSAMDRRLKIALNLLLIVTGAAVGLGVGFLWRNKPQRLAAVETTNVSPSLLSTGTPRRLFSSFLKSSPAVRSADDSPLATKLARDLSMSAGVTRWLHWLEALEKAQPADFPRLARLAEGNSSLLRLVAARWIDVNPRHMFDTLVASPRSGYSSTLASVLLEEWTKRDPDAVIAAMNEQGERSRNWRMRVAGSIIERNPERGLKLFAEWNIENYGPRMTAVTQWARRNPRHAAEFVLENPAGYVSREAMEAIGKEWARTDPPAALALAVSKRGELGWTLANATLKNWAERDVESASAWLAATDATTRGRLSPAFVESWAKYDASGALRWCEENLKGTALAQAVGGAIKGAADKDVAGAAALVSAMTPSAARAEAAVAIAEKWLPRFGTAGAASPELLTWLKQLDVKSLHGVMSQLQWRWADTDPKSLAAFLTSLAPEQVPPHAFSRAARAMVRQNPVEAFQFIAAMPAAESGRAAIEAFQEWQWSQPEAASRWLSELPANDPRRSSLFDMFVQIVVQQPKGGLRLATMSPADQAAARTMIEKMSMPDARRAELLESLKAK